ncbi:hypothetical protein E5D57_007697 [Metarhizium anisopliae]|nr:hypothetical protein E5D57_007697 [Metarhizium anisopliae]
MNFGDSSFLPLRFNFSTTQCDGQMIATFTTPTEVPNGEADILWQCAGFSPYCYQVNITNGTSDPSMQLDREAQVGCITELLKTSNVAITKVMPTRTATDTVVSVFTSTATLFIKSQTPITTSIPAQSQFTSGVSTPPFTMTDKDPTRTDTAAARAPSVGSVQAEMPPSGVSGRTVTTTPPSALTTDKVFDSAATRVTTPVTSSVVVALLTTTLLRTVTVSCATGKG